MKWHFMDMNKKKNDYVGELHTRSVFIHPIGDIFATDRRPSTDVHTYNIFPSFQRTNIFVFIRSENFARSFPLGLARRNILFNLHDVSVSIPFPCCFLLNGIEINRWQLFFLHSSPSSIKKSYGKKLRLFECSFGGIKDYWINSRVLYICIQFNLFFSFSLFDSFRSRRIWTEIESKVKLLAAGSRK